jgi:hypothetical protein
MPAPTPASLKQALKLLKDETAKKREDITARLARQEKVVQRYISTMDDTFARKLKQILASFGRQTRIAEMVSLKDTEITAYFARN